MKKTSTNNNESTTKTTQEQPNVSPETVIEPASAQASPPVPLRDEDTKATLDDAKPLEPAAVPTTKETVQGSVSAPPHPAATPSAKISATETTAAQSGTTASTTSNSKRSGQVRTVGSNLAQAKKGFIRPDPYLASSLNRMQHSLFIRTNLDASPIRMLKAIIAESDAIMDDIYKCWYFIPSAEPHLLKQKLEATLQKLAELSNIETRGKIISKFTLTAKEMTKLRTSGETLKTYFGVPFSPRDVLKLWWERGGILIAENLSKPQK